MTRKGRLAGTSDLFGRLHHDRRLIASLPELSFYGSLN